MAPAQKKLPEYDNPPVVEVALTVQFVDIDQLNLAVIGSMWGEILKDDYPLVQEHSPVEPVFERVGLKNIPTNEIRFNILSKAPVTRLWFLSENNSELIQIQRNRISFSWRSMVNEESTYPRYEFIKQKFIDKYNLISTYLKSKGIENLNANQCEVTYVNHIESSDCTVWDNHSDLDKVFSIATDSYTEPFPLDSEDFSFTGKYIIPTNKGEFLGRLHLNVAPVFSSIDDQPMYRMVLTARGRPDGDGFDGIIKFFNTGHEHIVNGFTSLTTVEMHQHWRRKNA